VPTYYVAEMTRRHVTVALNGDAGDENFEGTTATWPTSWLPASTDGRIRRCAGDYPTGVTMVETGGQADESPLSRPPVSRRVDRAAREALRAVVLPFLRRPAPRTPDAGVPAAAGDGDELAVMLDLYRATDARDFGDATLGVDAALYLPDDLLVKVDIASMAHALEARSPFLDHELMECAATIPFNLKVRGTVKKYILKRALGDLLPERILHRPKMGFGCPSIVVATGASRPPVRHASLATGPRSWLLRCRDSPADGGRARARPGELALSLMDTAHAGTVAPDSHRRRR